MARFTEIHKREMIDAVIETAGRRLGPEKAATASPFLRQYYARVPAGHIEGLSAETLFGAAYAHFRLAAQRQPGRPRLRVYNPLLEEHGWRSEHTVIEVVTDDMPFLVASLTAEVNRRELVVHRVIHPIFVVLRDGAGNLISAAAPNDEPGAGTRESFMHFEITHQSDAVLASIHTDVEQVLADVRTAVTDWQPMRQRLAEVISGLRAAGDGLAEDEIAEVIAFLEWLENNFTFLGCRRYRFESGDQGPIARLQADAGLGLLRDPNRLMFEDLRDGEPLPPAIRAFIVSPAAMVVTKANQLASVHRRVHMDTIGVKDVAAGGAVIGAHLLVGLFGASAYNRSPRSIPWLRRKVERVIASAGFEPRSHDGRALLNILETFPRDELFQVSEENLLATSTGILHLQQSQRVALFVRRDDFERFVACLIYVPRDRYNTEFRLRVQAILERAFNGPVTAHYSLVGDGPLARLLAYIRTTPGQLPDVDADDLEAMIAAATRSWADSLQDALNAAHGEEDGRRLFQRYANGFPPAYRERFSGDEAIADIDVIEQTLASGTLGMSLYRPLWAPEQQFRFKVFHPDQPIPLSQILPLLEHLGVRVVEEVPHVVRVGTDGGRTVTIHDFSLEAQTGAAIPLAQIRDSFQQAFLGVWQGGIESDRFNALVVTAGLSWRQAMILRAYCKYLRQAGIPFSQAYMEATLNAHGGLARLLVSLFETLFDPAADDGRDARANALRANIADALDRITNADEDRMLRRFFNAIDATLRTNFFQRLQTGEVKPYLSFKLDSRRLDELPAPRPMVEVFVYSPAVEAIHLRGGKVARGGIRWSDRREDFRTEILSLMKAQMVKNAVIVPVGAKGGFVVKRPPDPADRDAVTREGIACYQTLIRGLLDITDNLVGGVVRPPRDVVRRDDDDPYLVVAADKGTATFSDIANGISADYGFWLGDAFASGGSQGYDHKKMGITARGAWESVKRHGRELGKDVQREDFSVVGVGDMSGDVFGNGMLLSPHIKLLAAFDHRHIFVDPDPDPAASLEERRRLFALPRSSWQDYSKAVLSSGGQVFDRKAKTIELSPEIRSRFGLGASRVTPDTLIRSLLCAEVDLLWFGGIGTFVKAAEENNAAVGDRANDTVRVNANELRCKMIGEGANLGLTQLARIAFARKGGRINTDFIDNSAGVDCSDHEVNIKILLDAAVNDGDLTSKQRNALLVQMTDEVGELVLRDNYLQTQAISLIEADGFQRLDQQIRLMRMLERQGRLDRSVEFLPDDEGLSERATARQGLTRPEIAVLFSYCKVWLYDQILLSDLPDDPYLASDLVRYFPHPLRERLHDRMPGHPLKRELIATAITNSLINRVGGTFVTEVAEKSAAGPADIARAYIIARDIFAVRRIWEQIEALDNKVPVAVQTTLHREVQRLLERATLWFLRNGGRPLDIGANIAAFHPAVADFAAGIEALLPEDANSKIAFRAGRYRAEGVPEDLARRVAYLVVMPSACDIVRLTATSGMMLADVARLYFALGEMLGFGWLRYQAEKLPADSYWQRLAVAALIEELYGHQRALVHKVLTRSGAGVADALAAWTADNGAALDRTRALVNELEAAPAVDLSMLAVASRRLQALTEG